MLVPETKSLYIQSRHEIGREWACSGCDDPSIPPEDVTWAPLDEYPDSLEYVVYDGTERGSEGAIVMGIYFEDVYPQVVGSPGTCDNYYNELMLYHTDLLEDASLSAIPLEIVHITANTSAAGDNPELSLGIVEVGCSKGRFHYEGLGGRGYPINLQKGDKLVLRPLVFEGAEIEAQNTYAHKAGHTKLAVIPAYGSIPYSKCADEQSGTCIKRDWVAPEGTSAMLGHACNWKHYYQTGWRGVNAGWGERDCGMTHEDPDLAGLFAATPQGQWYHVKDSGTWSMGFNYKCVEWADCTVWELYNHVSWERRLHLNVILDATETVMKEQIL